MIECSYKTIQAYEYGYRDIPLDIAQKISKVFGLDLSLVLVGHDKQIELSDAEHKDYLKRFPKEKDPDHSLTLADKIAIYQARFILGKKITRL